QTRILVQKERKVFIPNVITANGDRLNDGFTAFGNYFADRINRLEIYDRWGGLIFKTENIPLDEPVLGWDGTHNGKNVLPGVFAYVIEIQFLDGETDLFYGDVTVLR
ncbi:MAG: gliding motility-associated C-terminal domain-containing protein, partial [Saprospiraceae bacterium]|nr:gliding motility-associated C-terminal domain-containing protein [Saprospiraceae bacterium]